MTGRRRCRLALLALLGATAAAAAGPDAQGSDAQGSEQQVSDQQGSDQQPAAPRRKTNPMPVVTPDGMFSEHTYEGSLSSPGGMFFDAWLQEIYVADSDNGLVGIFDAKGVPLFAFGSGLLLGPSCVGVDLGHRIYVLDHDRTRIRRFTFRGVPLGDVPLPGLSGRKDVVISTFHIDERGWMYVAENQQSEIFVYDDKGKLAARFGTVGADRGQFIAIVAITTDDEHIYVLDQVATAVQVFDRRGRFLRGWGEHNIGPEAFSLPSGITVDAAGRVFVADALRHEVKLFDAEGEYLGRFGGRGRFAGDFGYPGALAFDSSGNLLVLEKINGRVQRFRLTYANGERQARRPASEEPQDAAAPSAADPSGADTTATAR